MTLLEHCGRHCSTLTLGQTASATVERNFCKDNESFKPEYHSCRDLEAPNNGRLQLGIIHSLTTLDCFKHSCNCWHLILHSFPFKKFASDSPRIEVNCTQAYTTLGSDDAANATAIVCKSADSPKATLCSPQSCYHYSTCHGCRKIVTNENNVEEISDVFYDRVVCEKDYYLANRTTEETMDSICTDKNFDTYVCNGHYVGFAHCHNCTEVLDSEDQASLS